MELPDIHTVQLPSEGVTSADVLICTSNNGKTNQFGKLEFLPACVPRMCVHALYQQLPFFCSLGIMLIRSLFLIFHSQRIGMILNYLTPALH
jgi:hypothetical protein